MNRVKALYIPVLLFVVILGLPGVAPADPVFIPRLGVNVPSFSGQARFGSFESRTGYH